MDEFDGKNNDQTKVKLAYEPSERRGCSLASIPWRPQSAICTEC